MSASRRLWLVRHARPLVEPGLCYGSSDLPADAADTARAAHELAAVLPAGATLLMSGLRRAQQLALALHALRPELAPPVSDPRLNEMDFGRFELSRWDAIDRAEFDAWTADFHSHRFGGRESVAELLARVGQVLRDRVQGHPSAGMPDSRDRVWFTHAGVIRAASLLHAQPDARPRATDWPVHAPAFGGWLRLDWPRLD
ncbi:histidine phosphatase family protein [Malikia sp.]|uniref:histidine phosphatase family protein n=1 Tax=Malikia sp. TaxID=2070706 RepID=UPI00261C5FD3|nr:histidine phosphatase family protein [Malikia sp.]MDD2729692.1 histidine phosphatase family protein [Malikia sp.]